MSKLALSLAMLVTSPADAACHHYAYWAYPTPQHCTAAAPPARKTWFVEIKPEASKLPPDVDQRTDQQRQDEADHDRAVADHKNEINQQLRLLREPAVGIK